MYFVHILSVISTLPLNPNSQQGLCFCRSVHVCDLLHLVNIVGWGL